MNSQIFRLLAANARIQKREFHNTKCLSRFFERDPKGGYPIVYDRLEKSDPNQPITGKIRHGYQQLAEAANVLKDDVKNYNGFEGINIPKPNEIDVRWKFQGDPETLKEWVITSDSDYNAGFSTVSLELSPEGNGLFTGCLDTKRPKDGKFKRTGYCNMRSIPIRGGLTGIAKDWGTYTHMVLKVRGDGRSYMLCFTTDVPYDLMWHDVYMYPMYTRGGPYWQYVKVPFSRFFMSSKGRIDDNQNRLLMHSVKTFGITIADAIPGSYRLEIEYVGLLWDPSHEEKYAYEMHEVDPFILD